MIDLEKEKKLARAWHDKCYGDIDFIFNADEYVVSAWAERAELAQAEEAKLQAQIAELQQKLARYENPDYVLVPRKPTDEMIDAGLASFCDPDELDVVYQAMIEAVENDNESNN